MSQALPRAARGGLLGPHAEEPHGAGGALCTFNAPCAVCTPQSFSLASLYTATHPVPPIRPSVPPPSPSVPPVPALSEALEVRRHRRGCRRTLGSPRGGAAGGSCAL
jgi:hypothetical protein